MAFALGIGAYYLSQRSIALRKIQASGLSNLDTTGYSVDDVKEDNRDTINYLISGFLMVIVALLTIGLVRPMGWFDHYALLIDGGILLFFATGLALTWVDLELKILPSSMIYWGGTLSLMLFIGAAATKGVGGWSLILPMTFGGVMFFLFYFLIWFWFPTAFGMGDVRLSFFVGAFLSFLSIPAAFAGFAAIWIFALIGILIGAIFGMIAKNSQIPFGPWMILGALFGTFWGEPIVRMVMP